MLYIPAVVAAFFLSRCRPFIRPITFNSVSVCESRLSWWWNLTFSACIFDLHTCLSTQKSQLTTRTTLHFYIYVSSVCCGVFFHSFLPLYIYLLYIFYTYYLLIFLPLSLFLFFPDARIHHVCAGRSLVGKTFPVRIFIFTKQPRRKFYNSTNSVATWLSIFFGGISMLSKETGITVLLLNLTYDLYRSWPSLKRTVVDVHWSPETQHCYRRLSKLLLSMGILLVVRLALLQGSFPKFSQQDNPTAYHPSLYVRWVSNNAKASWKQ